MDEILARRVEAWIADDPDPVTRAELRALLERGDEAELADRFGARLEFGTAGLRGALGAGPNRMNRVVVTRAAAGLAALPARSAPAGRRSWSATTPGTTRTRFAEDTAEVLAGAGLTRDAAAAAAADARARVRGPRPRRARRRDGHRQPQPAARQRLQGLLGARTARRSSRRPTREIAAAIDAVAAAVADAARSARP